MSLYVLSSQISVREAALEFPFDTLEKTEKDEKLAPEHSGTRWGDRI